MLTTLMSCSEGYKLLYEDNPKQGDMNRVILTCFSDPETFFGLCVKEDLTLVPDKGAFPILDCNPWLKNWVIETLAYRKEMKERERKGTWGGQRLISSP